MCFIRRSVYLLLLASLLMLQTCGRPHSQPIQECGNALVEGREQCDGTLLSGATCESLGAGEGDLACFDYCAFDTSGCASPLPGATP